MMPFLRKLRRRRAGLPRIMWLGPALPRRMRPPPVTRRRFFAARLVFILGMTRIPESELLRPGARRATCGPARHGWAMLGGGPRTRPRQRPRAHRSRHPRPPDPGVAPRGARTSPGQRGRVLYVGGPAKSRP